MHLLPLSLSESSERRHALFHLTSDSHLTESTAAPAAPRSNAKRTYVNNMVSVAKKQDETVGEASVSAPAPPVHPPLPSVPPPKQDSNRSKPSQDPNLANPRLLVNRSCIYERRLPGDAYITAHVQRLQHGYYSCPAVSDKDFEHVDFLAVNFVFHSPNTLDHRFMAATIRASVHGNRKMSTPGQIQPRFLMHAPHLIYGAVSPETLQWNFGLAGSLGVSEFPVSASISPSGGVLGRYRRYEMMRIQGSARTLKSPHGRQHDVESGEIVWSLEENSLQRSGLPREFTFAMLIHKPRAESRIHFSLDIDPVIQSWYGSYPKCWLSLSRYQPVQRRPVDFRRDIGQRFETGSSSKEKRFNFATLESSFDEYVNMPGRRFTTGTNPDDNLFRDDNEFNPDVVRGFSAVESRGKAAARKPANNPISPPNDPPAANLNVRVLLDTASSGTTKRHRRMSDPERGMRRIEPLRRTRSGDTTYQYQSKMLALEQADRR